MKYVLEIQLFGGRGSSSGLNSGSIGSSYINSLPEWALKEIESPTKGLGNYGTKSYQEQFMRENGISDESIRGMNKLLDGHRIGGEAQSRSDAEIVNHLKENDSVGKALKMQIQMEEAMYDRYMKTHENANDRVYRKGSRKTGVESWTTNDSGADMGYGGIGFDHQSTISSLRSQGYRILGGIGRHLGSPGEAEITFVKWR